jgi:hypothetical protein
MTDLVKDVLDVMSRKSSGFATEVSVRAAIAEVFDWIAVEAEDQPQWFEVCEFLSVARKEALGPEDGPYRSMP